MRWSAFSLGIGAAAMYLLDPNAGNRRRAQLRQRVTGRFHELGAFLDATSRDVGHRARGVVCETRARLKGAGAVDDDLLVRRVASKMGRFVSHPRALGLEAQNGVVTLRGPILKPEVPALLAAIRKVPGVRDVKSQLDVRDAPGGLPALQGGRLRGRAEQRQGRWSNVTRLLAGAGGSALVLKALTRRRLTNPLLASAGAALIARSIANEPLRRMIGVGGGRSGISFQKTLLINAPTHHVFGFFSDFTNFPLFMHNIRHVRDLGDGRSFWTARGPAGIDVTWTALVTRHEPGRLLAWKSDADSHIAHAGMIEVLPESDGASRLALRMSYNPPAGLLGHVVASLFAADPKAEMDADLARAKTYLETGRRAHDAAVNPQESQREGGESNGPQFLQ